MQDYPQVRVLIAGKKTPQTEEYYTFLSTLVKEYRLDSIVIIGAEQNTFGRMAELYAAADICTLPSLREGLGLALLEAMATHVPIITTDTVGVTEIVTHNVNGLVIPVSDPKALADAIMLLTADPQKRKQLSSAAVTFMENSGFTYEAMARAHIGFYKEVLAASQARAETSSGNAEVPKQ